MKKLVFTLSLLTSLLWAGKTNAQLADNSIAPDWTMSDINGNSHHLYSLLDSGYVVFLDFSAAWCGPCWNYHHNVHALEDLWMAHGIPGDNKVRVFYIEGESTNTTAQLRGTSSGTAHATFSQGDWVTGTGYPIIDDASQDGPYNIGYFPTIYKICPNRLIKEVGQASAAALWTEAQACPALPTLGNDWAMVQYAGATLSCDSFGLTVKVQNNSTGPLTSVTVTAFDGATPIKVGNWAGAAAKYDVVDVDLGNVFLSTSKTLTFTITSADGNAANNSINASLTKSDMQKFDIAYTSFVSDLYVTETAFGFIDDAGTVVHQWSAPSSFANGTVYTVYDTAYLTKGQCYKFVFVDGSGDGIYDASGRYGKGYFRTYDQTGDTILSDYMFTGAQDLQAYKVKNFGVGINNVNTTSESFSVFPNPAKDHATVEFTTTEASNVAIRVYDAIGNLVKFNQESNVPAGKMSRELNLSGMSAGVYMINVTAGDKNFSKKITIVE